MFTIRPTASADIPTTIATLVDAFERDALMLYLFHKHPDGIRAGIETFFSILLRARIALDSPADVLLQDGEIRGAAMGNHTSPPAWPPALNREWAAFEASVPDFRERLEAYRAAAVPPKAEDEPANYKAPRVWGQ